MSINTTETNGQSVFCKGVKRDGGSLYATGQFRRVYELGETYEFPAHMPAHCFPLGVGPEMSSSFTNAWEYRPEPNTAKRVLLCMGMAERRAVPVADICVFRDIMNDETEGRELEERCASVANNGFSEGVWLALEERLASERFTVIGEIFHPEFLGHPGPLWAALDWCKENWQSNPSVEHVRARVANANDFYQVTVNEEN